MDFSAFDQTAQTALQEEVRNRWGNTAAFSEYETRKKHGSLPQNGEPLMAVFAKFGAVKHLAPESEEAQALAKALQDAINENYYTCTKEILASLGEMYVADERFRQNIDAAGGNGTAAFACDAIRYYCND